MWIKNKINNMMKEKKKRWLQKNASKIKITDLKNLVIEFSNVPQADRVASNAAYGHAYLLKQYAGIDGDEFINATINHATDTIRTAVAEGECPILVDKIFVRSKFDKRHIESVASIKAIPIGPYIAYAPEYCTQEELLNEKRKNGRTLLVYPCHGEPRINSIYDIQEFCEEIDQIAKGFNTVMVCLYYHDIRIGMDKFYKKRGYKVVCAGHFKDKYFLSRSRMIVQLSDAVMANLGGTALANALYFDKPVYIFKQEVRSDCTSTSNVERVEMNINIEQEFYEISSDRNFENLEKQKEWAKYYFGLDEVKSKEELLILLNESIRK